MIAVLTGMGLSAAAGLNAYIPFLVVALIAKYTDFIVLPAAYGWMESWWAIGIGAALLLTEVVVDKVPAVDTVNDAVQTFIRPSMGGLLAAATAGAAELDNSAWMAQNPWVGVLLGVVVAGLVHAGKTTARPAANVATLGVGAPVLSTVEDGASLGLSLIALFVPVLVVVALLAVLAALGWLVWRRRSSRRRRVAGWAERLEPGGRGSRSERRTFAHAEVDVARRRPVTADPGLRGGSPGPLRPVVDRFVAGTDLDAALPVIAGLTTDRLVTVDHLGENTTDRAGAEAAVAAYRALLLRLAAEGLADRVEVSVKLSALGQGLPDGDALALDGARAICGAAAEAGTTVTVDMEDHTTTDATLATVVALRADFPWVGAVLQSQLRRTEADCRDLAGPGSRVRLCKGAYDGAGVGRVHRPRGRRPVLRPLHEDPLRRRRDCPWSPRTTRDWSRSRSTSAATGPTSCRCSTACGPTPRSSWPPRASGCAVYVPYGTQWYGYFMRRLAERPANVAFFLRALASPGLTRPAAPPLLSRSAVSCCRRPGAVSRAPRPGPPRA